MSLALIHITMKPFYIKKNNFLNILNKLDHEQNYNFHYSLSNINLYK